MVSCVNAMRNNQYFYRCFFFSGRSGAPGAESLVGLVLLKRTVESGIFEEALTGRVE